MNFDKNLINKFIVFDCKTALRVFPHNDVIGHIYIVMEQPLYSEGSVSHITFAR